MMNTRVYKRSLISSLAGGIAPAIFTLAVILLVAIGLGHAEEANRASAVRLLEEAVVRAAIHSYAVEGGFPAGLEHLIENYGIHIDRNRFLVHYEVFAVNILPDIRVFEINR